MRRFRGTPAQSTQSLFGVFHIVHASLMSQQSQEFLLFSIFPVFSESHRLISTGRDWGKETQTPLAESRIVARCLSGCYSADS